RRIAHHLLRRRADAALAADPDAREEGGDQAEEKEDESDDDLTVGQRNFIVAGLVGSRHVVGCSAHVFFYDALPINAFMSSIGSGKMIVEFFSAEISVNVCMYRSCNVTGFSDMTIAASASLAEASSSPEAWMILARFSRSASAWRAIARCISCVRSTFLTSTIDTLMPHGSVCVSMISWSLTLSCSRSESSSSRSAWPSTERRVVWASWLVA